MRHVQIAVVGGGRRDPAAASLAEEVGRLLAERGCVLVCGGLGGVMEAACRGASGAGGVAIGILPGESPAAANEHVTYAVATGTGHARNLAVVASGEAVVAIGGEWGTASEIAFARLLGRPVVVVGDGGPAVHGEGIVRVATAAEAVEAALRLARRV